MVSFLRKVRPEIMWGMGFTMAYVGAVFYIHWYFQGHFRVFDPFWTATASEVGSMLAGVSSPLVLFWLILGHFVQAKQLQTQMQQLVDTNLAVAAQVALQTEILERERTLLLPKFALEYAGSDNDGEAYRLANLRATVTNVSVTWNTKYRFHRARISAEEPIFPSFKIKKRDANAPPLEGANSIGVLEIIFQTLDGRTLCSLWTINCGMGSGYAERYSNIPLHLRAEKLAVIRGFIEARKAGTCGLADESTYFKNRP